MNILKRIFKKKKENKPTPPNPHPYPIYVKDYIPTSNEEVNRDLFGVEGSRVEFKVEPGTDTINQ